MAVELSKLKPVGLRKPMKAGKVAIIKFTFPLKTLIESRRFERNEVYLTMILYVACYFANTSLEWWITLSAVEIASKYYCTETPCSWPCYVY